MQETLCHIQTISRSSKNLTLVDVNKFLNRLAPAIVLDEDFNEDDVALGEHAPVYWYEEKVEWYFGVVADILNDKQRFLYLMRSSKSDSEWRFYKNIRHKQRTRFNKKKNSKKKFLQKSSL